LKPLERRTSSLSETALISRPLGYFSGLVRLLCFFGETGMTKSAASQLYSLLIECM